MCTTLRNTSPKRTAKLTRFGTLLCLLPLSVALSRVPAQAQQAAGAPIQASDALRQDIDAARKKVYPALVNISVVVRYYNGGRAQRSSAGGSGVIVSKEGHVITNFHVAGNTTRITCTLPSGEAIEAAVVTHDPLTDISILKLHLEKRVDPNAPLPFATIGNSDLLQVGDYVLAMGNPMMLSSSMTLGIVSNTKRVFTDFLGNDIEDMTLDEGEKTGLFTRWLQHDALILPGNSGGPLVNLKGEVVGINELGGGGVGFAIPSNIAASVYQQAVATGEIKRGWLGITVLPVKKIGRTTGALVSAVWPNSPAEKAGIVPGDILTEMDGQPVNVRFFEEVPLFYQSVAAESAGKSVSLKYLRDNSEKTAAATVVQMAKYLGKEGEVRPMGITVQEITEPMALLQHFPNRDGVYVTGVRTGFPFETAKPDIKAEDVILSIGGKKVNSADEFAKAAAGVGEQPVVVEFRRDRENLVTVVRAQPEKPSAEGTELPKAWLGAKTQVLVSEVAAAMSMANTKGFRVTEVYPYTEAAKSGLAIGDVITAVNKTKLTATKPQDAEELRTLVEDLTIGDKADLTVLRDGKPRQIAVTLEAAPASSDQAKKARSKEFEFGVRDLTPLDRMEQHWKQDQQGVLVSDITEGGWANLSGLRSGDLVLSIAGQKIEDVAKFEQVMKKILTDKPKVIQIFVRREQRTHFIFIEPVWEKLTLE